MNKQLLDFVRQLSVSDKKSLTQKALKTTEEVGELAKAVLPFENAAGTLHRVIDKNVILESVADVMLCAISIAQSLGYTDDEIDKMTLSKAKKWAGLQAKEDKVKFPLPYEIHITVSLTPEMEESFMARCKSFGIKPIIIELEKGNKTVMRDVMTSSVHYGDNASALRYANDIASMFKTVGYIVARVKIETVPWHPAAPSNSDGMYFMPEKSYFESHLRIVTTEARKAELKNIAKVFEAHLSRNFFKKLDNDQYIIMMTLRSFEDTSESFKSKVDDLKGTLADLNFQVDKTEIEFAIYDTKVLHDVEWTKKENHAKTE